MADKCRVCGTKLDSDICPNCGVDNSYLYNKSDLRILIVIWAFFSAISAIAIFLTSDYEKSMVITAALCCCIMMVGTILQYITKFIYFTNIAGFIATIIIPVPLFNTEPTGGGWGGLFCFAYIIIPSIIISVIINAISFNRKAKAH